jgi:UDP-2,3-diacylglucosamine hydrolase
MKSYYFLSDLHLRDMQDPKAQNLLRFFISQTEQAPQTVLFLVGDIFDLWLGKHDYFINRFKPLIEVLKKFIDKGGEVHYFEGNHDLHLKKFWQDDLGVIVHSAPEFFHLDDEIVRVEHGDEMDPEDTGYIFLRWLLRTPLLKWIILNLPGSFVAWIGKLMSRTSRVYTNSIRDPQRILKVIHTHAQKVFSQKPFQVIISGHVHLRDEISFVMGGQKMTCYNLGSWDDKCLVLKKSNRQWQWIDISLPSVD